MAHVTLIRSDFQDRPQTLGTSSSIRREAVNFRGLGFRVGMLQVRDAIRCPNMRIPYLPLPAWLYVRNRALAHQGLAGVVCMRRHLS